MMINLVQVADYIAQFKLIKGVEAASITVEENGSIHLSLRRVNGKPITGEFTLADLAKDTEVLFNEIKTQVENAQ